MHVLDFKYTSNQMKFTPSLSIFQVKTVFLHLMLLDIDCDKRNSEALYFLKSRYCIIYLINVLQQKNAEINFPAEINYESSDLYLEFFTKFFQYHI